MRLINKRDYRHGGTCLRLMVLERTQRDPNEEPDPAAQYSFDIGNSVGELARQLFPGGVLVAFGNDRVADTRRLIEEETPVIFEAAFATSTAQAILDVLVRQPDGSYHAYEAKSATRPKDDYFPELAIQGVVAAANGVRITGYHLIYVNREAVFDGVALTTEFLASADVTDKITPLLHETEVKLGLLHAEMNRDDIPAAELKFACKGCDWQETCHGVLPDRHDLFLPGMNTAEFKGVQSGKAVVFAARPEKVKDFQRVNFNNSLDQSGYVAAEAQQELAAAPYPHVFLDFEVLNARLPMFAGTKAYEQLQFQFSAHIREVEGGELHHVEYLPEHAQDPRAEFSERLHEVIRDAGTIFTYSHYENTQLNDLLNNGFPFAELNVAKLESCELDLYKIVKKHTYHPGYRGSFSIKTVLPSWVPELSYKDLKIQEGMVAAVMYHHLVKAHGTPAADQIRADMLAYCKLDTLAMVRVYEALLAFQPTGEKLSPVG